MAGAVSNLMVRAGFDGSNLQRGLRQMQSDVRGANSSVTSALHLAYGAIAGYIGSIGVQYDAMAQSSQVAWTTLLGSATKAKQMVQDISTFAAQTQFDTEGVNAMATYLNNAGYAGKSLFDELQRVADVSGAFNITADNAKEMVRQMSQVSQATIAYTQDLNQLQDQGIPIYKAIASELGVTVAQVRKMASQGKITSDIYNKAFNSIASTVKGASNAQSQTFNGMISTLKDDFSILMGILEKPIFDALSAGMTQTLNVMNAFVSLGRGDLKGFSSTMDQTFGSKAGVMVLNFARNIQQGAQVLNSFVGKAKIGLKSLFDYLKGDDMGGLTLLTKLGLDPEMVVKIDAVLMGIRGFITGFFSSVSSLFKGKNNFGSSFSEMFQSAKSLVMPIFSDIVSGVKNGISQLRTFWNQNGKQITQGVKDALKLVADTFKNVVVPAAKLLWDTIKIVGVPLFNGFMSVLKFFTADMKSTTLVLGAVATSIAAFKIINGIITLYKNWQIITKAMTIAQAALDVVLDANPIGAFALAIGAVVAAGIYMWQNWDTVSTKMSGFLNAIERAAASMTNGVIGHINDLIKFIDKIPGVSIPLIPKVSWGSSPADSLKGGTAVGMSSTGTRSTLAHFATGTNFAPGGISLVGENGPELVDLPRGSKVHTNYQTNNLPDAIASAVGTAVVQAMQFNKQSSSPTGDLVFQVDGRTLARIMKPYNDLEQKRVGTKMTIQPI